MNVLYNEINSRMAKGRYDFQSYDDYTQYVIDWFDTGVQARDKALLEDLLLTAKAYDEMLTDQFNMLIRHEQEKIQ